MLLGRHVFAAAAARAVANAVGRRHRRRDHLHSWCPRPPTLGGGRPPEPWRPSSRCYGSGDAQSSSCPKTDGGAPPRQNVFQRFKETAKKYWYIVLPVHLVTSAAWLGSFYALSSSGVDVAALLNYLGFPPWIVDKVSNGDSWKSHLVITYGLYKIFTPLRYAVTLFGTGLSIRYLRRLGYAVGAPTKKP